MGRKTKAGEPSFALRRLVPADADAYRELRLEALRQHPEAFAAAWEDEAARSPAWFAERLEKARVFGGFSDDALLGTAGLYIQAGAKEGHNGVLWGMFVCPQARGTGLAAALVERVLDEARGLVEEVKLTVAASNEPAVRLYTRCGFTRYGLERRALKVGARYYDQYLMARSFGA